MSFNTAFDFVIAIVDDIDIDNNQAHVLDSFGRRRIVPVHPRRGVYPLIGETWILDRSLGELAFHSCLIPNQPVVTTLDDLVRALDDLGLIEASGLPVGYEPGMVMQYAGTVAPEDWLICDGSEVGRTEYPELFAAISTFYGVGDGSTTFNLPDMRDSFPVGAGLTYSLGDTGGAATVALTIAELASHDHNIGNHTHGSGNLATSGDNHSHNVSNQTANHSHNTGNTNHNHDGRFRFFSQGQGNVDFWTAVEFDATAGTDKIDQITNNSGAHSHNVSANDNSHSHNTGGDNHSHNVASGTTAADSTGNTGATGSGTAHENRPPYLAMSFIIYAGPSAEASV